MRKEERACAVIGMGSNLGDGRQLIRSAWKRLAEKGGGVPLQLSSLYESEAVDMESAFLFTNAVALVETDLGATALLRLLLHIEAEHGRWRDRNVTGHQDRALDLDLLYCGDMVMETPELILPHPHIADRLFVLAPLAEIAPGFCDPVTGLTAEKMHAALLLQIQRGEKPQQHVVRIAG